ncbi:hypothetical protein RUM43_002023 [Polyplax serrata]|uniref:limulus clotting factor C n=1 Tax=Polyplax serrata TaxID=468196 RepID=A0AAN8PFF2_POLSC
MLNISEFVSIAEIIKSRIRRSGGFPKFPVIKIDERSDPLTCGSRTVEHRPMVPNYKIVGGSIPPYGAYPWQVGIQAYKEHLGSYEHNCGGALIGPQLVLTAGHCIKAHENKKMRVVLGDYNLESHDDFQHTYKIEKFVIHPEFRKNGPYSNDIALIKLKGTPRVNSHVQYICLPDKNEVNRAGEWCVVSGWGANKPDYPDAFSVDLRAAAVPLISLDKCRSPDILGGRRQSILDSMICAGRLNGGVDACAGDSGGPLACKKNGKFYLTGIVSWGDGCAKKNRPGVYTRVAHYQKWIEETSKKLGT